MLVFTIWPLFAVIVLGYVLARAEFPGAGFWPSAERFNYFLLFPALLFSSLADAPVRDPAILRLGGAAVATILIATAVLVLVRRVRPVPAARFGPAIQGLVRFNTYLGLAVVTSVSGLAAQERAAVYLAVAVPLVNVLSIMALSGSGGPGRWRMMVRSVLRNPLILACAAGIVVALTGTGLPYGIGDFLSLLAQGSLPLGLLCVGAALQPAALRGDVTALAAIGGTRLAVMPVLAAGVAMAFGLTGADALVLIVFSAVPTAPTAYVLTRQLGGDATLMAGLVTGQTLAAVITIPLILALIGYG